jgi:hypothetical protein
VRDRSDTGAVVAQFPHLLSVSVAIAYHLAGTTGAARIAALWACSLARRVFLWRAAHRTAGVVLPVVLLALNVVEVWVRPAPNAEVLMQTLLFGGLLPARTQQDDDPFFGWVAGLLMGLLVFLRFDTFMASAAMGAGLALVWIIGSRLPRAAFAGLVAIATVLGLAYYTGPMRAYFFVYKVNLPTAPVGMAVTRRGRCSPSSPWPGAPADWRRDRAGTCRSAGHCAGLLAAHALFLRHPIGKLTDWDAYALRTFRDAYAYWPALVTALAGCVMVTRREFGADPAFFLVFAAFSVFLLLQDPRRAGAVLDGAAVRADGCRDAAPGVRRGVRSVEPGIPADGPPRRPRRRSCRSSAGSTQAARAVAAHVEYKGAIRQIDQLARRFTPRDLILLESRNSGRICTCSPCRWPTLAFR